MNDKQAELISSLLDEERHLDNIDQLLNDPKAKQTWERYHLARDVLHDQVSEHIQLELSTRICAAIEQEPVLNKKVKVLSFRKRLPEFVKRAPGFAIAASVTKQAAGFAIAASVTAVTIFSYQNFLQQQPNAAEPYVASAEPIVSTTPSMASVNYERSANPVNQLTDREKLLLSEHLQFHNQASPGPGYSRARILRILEEESKKIRAQRQKNRK